MDVVYIENPDEKAALCRRVLEALPGWFGVAESREKYISDSRVMPMLAVREGGEHIGFLLLKNNYPDTAEIYCMGLLPYMRGHGAGRALVDKAVEEARSCGARLMEVKTLDFSDSDPGYAETRAFYLAMGFMPLDCLPELWGEDNPCMIMVKVL